MLGISAAIGLLGACHGPLRGSIQRPLGRLGARDLGRARRVERIGVERMPACSPQMPAADGAGSWRS